MGKFKHNEDKQHWISCVAFWVTFTVLESNLLVTQRMDQSFVFVVVLLLLFHLPGKDFISFSSIIGRTISRRTVLFISLAVMAGSTIAITFAISMGIFRLAYMLMAIRYFPAISITAHLHMPKKTKKPRYAVAPKF